MLTDSELLKHAQPSGASDDRTTVETSAEVFTGVQAYPAVDLLAVEEPLELQLAYGPTNARRVKSISVTMRTPGHDFELAAGFLVTEGVVRNSADITQISDVAGCSNPLQVCPSKTVSREAGSRRSWSQLGNDNARR